MVVKTIRPDTVFIPYHWPGRRSANLLTHRTLDPRSKIPEYKVSACRIEKAAPPADLEAWRLEETGWTLDASRRRKGADERIRVLRRSVALHRLPRLRGGVRRVRHATAACR